MSILQRLFPLDHIIHTIKRFPLSIVSAIILFVTALIQIHNPFNPDQESLGKIMALCVCGFFWFGGVRLFAERHEFTTLKHVFLNTIGFLSLLSILALTDQWMFHWMFITPTLVLVLMICPYICLLYTSPSPRDQRGSRMPSSA